ncbi:hypothetical protein MKX03_007943, partial [Papaver bracteatum]
MGFQDSKSNIYGDDGSTSTQAVLVGIGTDLYAAGDCRPKAVISKACKGDDGSTTFEEIFLVGADLIVSHAVLPMAGE